VEGGRGSERSSSCNAPGWPRIKRALACGAGGGQTWNKHSFRRVSARGGAGAVVVAREGPQLELTCLAVLSIRPVTCKPTPLRPAAWPRITLQRPFSPPLHPPAPQTGPPFRLEPLAHPSDRLGPELGGKLRLFLRSMDTSSLGFDSAGVSTESGQAHPCVPRRQRATWRGALVREEAE
jgi:hypothetical protein